MIARTLLLATALITASSAAAVALDAAIRAVARRRERRARAIMISPQRNMLEVDCSIWSAALTTLAFIS